MQCGLGVGFFVASFVWLFVSGSGPDAWRYMYLIGVLPGLWTLWIRRGIPESERWVDANNRRRAAVERKRTGAAVGEHERALTRFTLVDLFVEPEIRRRTIVALLMSLATTFGWWGISSWIPPYIGSVAAQAGMTAAHWASYAGLSYNAGAIAGYIGLGFLADAYGRKPITALYFVMAFVLTPVLFLWAHELHVLLIVACVAGFFSLGQYSWMPTWLPELYPTRVRGTGIAFGFNAPRFIAWTGPLIAGTLIANFGGYGRAAMTVAFIYAIGLVATLFLPETRGKPLPETV
jgi:MFS family permease